MRETPAEDPGAFSNLHATGKSDRPPPASRCSSTLSNDGMTCYSPADMPWSAGWPCCLVCVWGGGGVSH